MQRKSIAYMPEPTSEGRQKQASRHWRTIAIRVQPTEYSPALLPSDSRTLSLPGRFTWRSLQIIMLAIGAGLIALLLLKPEWGLPLMWKIIIPVAPALILFAPGLWRNICPMATVHQLPKLLGISQYRKMPEWGAAGLSFLSVAGLFIIVPMRHIGLNTDGTTTAIMLILAAVTAWMMGVLFEARSGWCTTLCPIHPVEKLYGTLPAVQFKNARCDLCENCTVPCPDSTPLMSPTNTGTTKLQKILGTFMVGSFPGFIFGWYQVKDYLPGEVGFTEVVIAYAWPFGAALVSYLIFRRIERIYRWRVTARQNLQRAFAAAAISIYYCYSLPAMISLFIVPPIWLLIVLPVVTTAFFFWFLLLRSPQGKSWLVRPIMASSFWSSQFKKTQQKCLIHVGPSSDITSEQH